MHTTGLQQSVYHGQNKLNHFGEQDEHRMGWSHENLALWTVFLNEFPQLLLDLHVQY